MSLIIYAILGYLCGSIPTGVLVGRYKGVDPRTSGSKNIGASNVTRVMGKTAGLVTLLVDVFKGLLPTVIISSTVGDHWLVGRFHGSHRTLFSNLAETQRWKGSRHGVRSGRRCTAYRRSRRSPRMVYLPILYPNACHRQRRCRRSLHFASPNG